MSKKENIRQLFNNIAPSYDRLNHLLSMGIDRLWRRKAVKVLNQEKKPMNYLDIACGTGDFTIDIAEKALAGSRLTGGDISEGMMEIARKKVQRKQPDLEITFQYVDCEDMPFADRSFDRISVGFGVRNFENREKGLQEVCRVLKDDGIFVILELSIPQNRLLRGLYHFYFYKMLPCIGGMISGNKGAYTYLPDSVGKFPAPHAFKAILERCGFNEVTVRSLSCGICHMYVCRKRA